VEDLTKDLNEVQKEAVTSINGPVLVIAGAGSGKTRVLTYRIAYLLSQGVQASDILALTFTNKAAAEMKERIGQLVGTTVARNLWMGTFHSIFARILRAEASNLGYTSNFTIYDTSDSRNVIKRIIKDMKLDEQIYKPAEIQSRISMAKNNLITVRAYSSNAEITERDKSSRKPLTSEIYQKYIIRCQQADAMDFDDLLLNTNILFRDFPEVLSKYQKFFKYILVDEYQDTNFSQYLIVQKLATTHKNVCVVGDDAQSIYSFRGAKIENILNFKNDYPEYKLFKLEQNYRSTKNIVEAANSIIAKNKNQIQKTVFSENDEGEKIQVLRSMTDTEEGFIVSSAITELMRTSKYQYSDFAILYRTNAQSRIFEETLRKKSIPYKVYGGLSFYQRKEIKDLIAYYRLTINHKDEEAIKRIINYPARGIGETTLAKIDEYAQRQQVPIWEVISTMHLGNLDINKGTADKLVSFVKMIQQYEVELKVKDAYDLALTIAMNSGIINDLKIENTTESMNKLENVEELLNGIKDFTNNFPPEAGLISLDHYLENVSLLTDADNEKSDDKNKVSIMTIHSAKGLEFKNVFIAGVEEDLFPSRFSASSINDIEEERRLFYVAVTRAKEHAFLSYSESRYKWGIPSNCSPSRFISEIDDTYLDFPMGAASERPRMPIHEEEGFSYPKNKNSYNFQRKEVKETPTVAPPSFPKKMVNVKVAGAKKESSTGFTGDDPSLFQPGMKVEHERFGIGKILQIEGQMPDAKATVFFQNSGQKQLLLRYAKLKILDTLN
jgi:DNA helicase II / ATP-dependent DNA helicase PcrA